uniref:Actin interacting protein 3-like C-terminal domain-containing protein n=1 Tax=Amphiprion ocellaris TaxID=80972 RepID=A0AAQ5YY52_AMPOC
MNINSTYILTRCSCVSSEQTKSNLKVTSPEDAERVSRRQASPNGTASSRGDSKGGRTVPRRHTLGGARSSREILAMQPSDMDKKREAFLEHLKQKYPHHASAIMGHQERLREQSRSPKHGPSPQPSVGDQVDHLSLASLESLDAMSETDAPTTFTRGSRVRASLPVVRSTNQTKDRSLGVLYLQYGDETKQIRMPNEITSIDTIRALFVSAFPQQLTMKMLESPSVAVYVKDDMRNMYYELADVRNITDHSCLKVYHKDPAQAFSHGARPANGDARMHNEMAHASRDGQHPLRHPPMGPPAHHPMQGALPPTPHSMPPSPSRIPFGPRQGSIPGNATIPRDRLSNANPPARSISPCPSAILERRDVKPDEDVGGKSHSLARGNEGLYADPYLLQEGRMTMAAGHGPHPNPGLEGPEHGLGGFHRASIRSTGSYSGPSPTDTMDHPSLYRQKSRNSQLPTLGSKTPPPSPHRMTEVRMIDIHSGPPHGVPPHGRSSPVRQSFRKEEVAGTKPRNNMGSPVVTDIQGHIQGPIPAASGSPVLAPKSNAAPSEKSSVPLKVNLLQFRKNVSDLRMQLHQMRQLQLQNQEALRVQLKRAEQEISIKLAEAMRRLEDPVQRQRALVEEDRHKYLGLEERVLAQLSELEQFVGSLQKDSATTQRVVTLKDVEEGAVTLRKVGESLAGLKGEFPALQTRMRAVLRVEVEAVKFLKEEPHKLDSMLKRVKSLTDTLSSLRRSATEFSQKGPDPSTAVSVDNSPAAAAAEAPLEPQTSTIRSEVMPSSPVVIHHVQSSPVHMQQSQQSAALTAQPTAASDPPSPARQKKTQGNPVNNGNGTANQDLVIEELQNSQDKSKNRAMSIEAAEKEWEERRQNMGHYDGKEFEKILQEAQANMMKGIPSLEKPAKPALERPSKTAIRPAAPDSLTRQGSDKASKSPPPPPPRKTYPSSSSGMTTTRSGEVVYTNRKESVAAQVLNEQGFFILTCKCLDFSYFLCGVCFFSIFFLFLVLFFVWIPLQNTSVASPTSRMPVPLSAKSRQSPGTTDKAGKQQKLQDAQRQFRQANGSAKRVGGDHKTTSPTVPISKIPAFYPSSTKGSSQCAPNSDATNPINPSSSSSSSSSSVTKSSTLSSRSGSLPSSHIPSLSNGSLKLPSQHTGKALSFSSQTPNGRVHSSSSSSSFSSSSSSCSSSSPSPLSPTPLGPGGKSIRTIHTPSFTSYRSHNGSNGKSCIPTATAAKDTT